VATPIIMPKFGMVQEKATVVQWLYGEGDRVERGEPLLEVETDKAVMEVEAPATGWLRGVRVRAGDVVPVATVIAYVVETEEEMPSNSAQAPAVLGRSVSAKVEEEAPEPPRPVGERRESARTAAGPAQPEAQVRHPAPIAGLTTERVRATPAARRLAREAGVRLRDVPGRGPRGRIQAADVRATLEGAAGREAEQVRTMPRAVPFERAHVLLTARADMTAALALKAELEAYAQGRGGPEVLMTAILAKALAWAVARYRASVAEQRIGGVTVGVVTPQAQGTGVLVIHGADRLGILDISRRLADPSERSRQEQSAPAGSYAANITLSDLGAYGVERAAVLGHGPEDIAHLTVGRIVKRMVIVESAAGDVTVTQPSVDLTLSVAESVIPSALAARLLNDVVAVIEAPSLMLT